MTIGDNLAKVLSSIQVARAQSQQKINLVAVSKLKPVELLQEYQVAAEKAGIPVIFGENYVQEFRAKKPLLRGSYEAHLIGPLQSNKAKDAVSIFDVIESVHTEKIARVINREAAKLGKTQRIYLQVNISNDSGKSGFTPDQVITFLRESFDQLTNLKLEGLMTITALYEVVEDARPDFKALTKLAEKICSDQTLLSKFQSGEVLLSMGMSQDYAIAIEEGATTVRVGTSIFGERT